MALLVVWVSGALLAGRIPLKPPPEPQLQVFAVTVTAYSSTRDQTDSTPFITGSGTRVHPGTLALSPDMLRRIPYGTTVLLGGRAYTVEDAMHPRWTARADIWFPRRRAAIAWGVRKAELVILAYPAQKRR